MGIVPEPQKCAGCYSVLFTGWGAAPSDAAAMSPAARAAHSAGNTSARRAEARGHALPRGRCPPGDERCEVYQGFKPACAALIRNKREAAAARSAPKPFRVPLLAARLLTPHNMEPRPCYRCGKKD